VVGRPPHHVHLQTIWLERTLADARRDPSVDIIVVFMHQCAMSTSVPGNGSDLAIRQTWLPLFEALTRRTRRGRPTRAGRRPVSVAHHGGSLRAPECAQ
jgi:hypothetical protein